MKQVTINGLAETLKNWKGTAAVGMETLTVPFTGNKAEAAALLALGYVAKNIKKRAWVNVLVTDLSYETMIKHRKDKEVMEALAELQVTLDDIEAMFDAESLAKLELTKDFKASERTNGETISGALVLSAKDNHPMINCYFTLNKPRVQYEYDGKVIDVKNLPFFSKEKPVEGAKQIRFGIKHVLVIRNYRLENVKNIRFSGENYEVTA